MLEKNISEHSAFLMMSLEEAKKGSGSCAPNPAVGCVAVQKGRVLAKAFHHSSGLPHAESLVLQSFPANTPDVTLYVTLEPCNHFGKTPPCVDAIIAHGIKKVVYAYRDPNPIVRSSSTDAILNAHGIEVIHYPVDEITLFYRSYRYWMMYKKPWVTVKWAQSLDGKIGYPGKREKLSNALTDEWTHLARKRTDIILTTKNTIVCDDPLFNARIDNQSYSKKLAILDSKLTLTGHEQCFKYATLVHIFHQEDVQPHFHLPHVHFHAVNYAQGLSLDSILSHLGEIGYHDVWVEAGAQLIRSLHQEDLVNTSFVYIVPRILGPSGIGLLPLDFDLNKNDSFLQWTPMGDNMLLTINWQG